MQVNADFSIRAAVHMTSGWVPSPMAGVDRHMLERQGGEVARATSIVRYAPGSNFPSHVHTGGEEYLVLEGIFQDEAGDHGTGHYLRNPPGSSHAPRSDDGCVILVKLWQMTKDEVEYTDKDTNTLPWQSEGNVQVQSLFRNKQEVVEMQLWEAEQAVVMDLPFGGEFLVVTGSFQEGGEEFVEWSWLRLPPGQPLECVAGKSGARVWIKKQLAMQHIQRPDLGI